MYGYRVSNPGLYIHIYIHIYTHIEPRWTTHNMDQFIESNVKSGLRPKEKKRVKREGGEPNVPAALVDPNSNPYSNPMTRLGELLLPWATILTDFKRYTSPSTVQSRQEQAQYYSKLRALPLIFESFRDYLDAWEPLIIEEIKTGVLNNMSARVHNITKSATQRFSCNVSESTQNFNACKLITLDCNFEVKLEQANNAASER